MQELIALCQLFKEPWFNLRDIGKLLEIGRVR